MLSMLRASLLIMTVVAASKRNIRFLTKSNFAGKLCIPEFGSTTWSFAPASSAVGCVVQCSRADGCKGVFYNRLKNTCFGGSHVFHDVGGCPNDDGSVYMTLETVPYQGICDGTVPCAGDNTVCWEGKCLCEPGYSLWPSRTVCLANCSEVNTGLGSTFQGYPGWLLFELNGIQYQDISLATCLQRCVNWSDGHRCVSAEYHLGSKRCTFSSATALTNPLAFQPSPTGEKDYHHRNCQ